LLRFGDLHELLENARYVFGRYSDSLIGDCYLYTVVFGLFARDGDRLPLAELDGGGHYFARTRSDQVATIILRALYKQTQHVRSPDERPDNALRPTS